MAESLLPHNSDHLKQAFYERLLARENMPTEIPSLIDVPHFALEAFERARDTSHAESGENPTFEDIEHAVRDIQSDIDPDEVRALARALWINSQSLSFSENDPRSPSISDQDTTDRSDFNRAMNKVLPHLRPTQQSVIKQFYGIDEDPKTLSEISAASGISYNSVAAIRQNGLTQLKHPRHSYLLDGYIGTHDPQNSRYYFKSRYLLDRN